MARFSPFLPFFERQAQENRKINCVKDLSRYQRCHARATEVAEAMRPYLARDLRQRLVGARQLLAGLVPGQGLADRLGDPFRLELSGLRPGLAKDWNMGVSVLP